MLLLQINLFFLFLSPGVLDSGNRDAAAASAEENFFASSSIDKIKLKNRDRSTQNT